MTETRVSQVVVKRRVIDEGARSGRALSDEDPIRTEGVGGSVGGSWTNPWCQDPNCNTKTIHTAHLGVHHVYMAAQDIFGDPTEAMMCLCGVLCASLALTPARAPCVLFLSFNIIF